MIATTHSEWGAKGSHLMALFQKLREKRRSQAVDLERSDRSEREDHGAREGVGAQYAEEDDAELLHRVYRYLDCGGVVRDVSPSQ